VTEGPETRASDESSEPSTRAESVLQALKRPYIEALSRQLVLRLVLLGIIRILAGIAKDVPHVLIDFLWVIAAIFVIDAIAHYLVYEQLTFHPDQSMGADK